MPKKRRKTEPTTGRIVYFLPGQLYLLVEHPSGLDTERLVDQIQKSNFVQGSRDLASAVIEIEQTLTFDRKDLPELFERERDTGQATVLEAKEERRRRVVPPNRRGQAWEKDDLYKPTQDAFSLIKFVLPSRDDKLMRQHKLIRLIDRLNDRIIKEQFAPENNLAFRAASPNWLAIPSPDNAGGSGPGGAPRAYDGDPTNPQYLFTLNNLPDLVGKEGAQPVDVAILDSAPSPRSLIAAYNTWAANHELLRNLLGPDSCYGTGNALEVIYATELGARLPTFDEVRVKHHNYPMTDHGLFAAGIIHSIAPNAQLRLLEVLNPYGIGTLSSIGQGLLWLARERAESDERRPLIINMSLMLVTPLSGQSTKGLEDWQIFARPGSRKDLRLDMLTLSIEWICAMLRDQDVLIVASAGNDGDDPDVVAAAQARGGKRVRPQARYPAAFPTVLGVGALEENSDTPTSYSNLADQPDGTGIATFGGTKDPSGETQEEGGILGVYIGDFPIADTASDGYFLNENANGWAWWAGTSFAAPVISGVLAALAGITGSLDQAEQALEEATDSPPPTYPVGGVLPAQQR